MKYRDLILIPVFIIVLISCGSSSNTTEGKNSIQKLDELMSMEHFEIRSDWALPLATNSLNSIANAGLLPPGSSAGQISLIGNANYVKVMGDSLSVYLPYFGERQMGGGYNSDGAGIEFIGVPKKMEITKDKEKQRYDIRFEFKKDSENFMVIITLLPNLQSTININSSQRFPIRYSGSVETLTIDK